MKLSPERQTRCNSWNFLVTAGLEVKRSEGCLLWRWSRVEPPSQSPSIQHAGLLLVPTEESIGEYVIPARAGDNIIKYQKVLNSYCKLLQSFQYNHSANDNENRDRKVVMQQYSAGKYWQAGSEQHFVSDIHSTGYTLQPTRNILEKLNMIRTKWWEL